MFTLPQLKKFAPTARPVLLQAIMDGIPEMQAAGISTGVRIRHFLVQIAVETGGFRSIDENLNYTTAARLREVWPTRFKTDASTKPYLKNPQALAEKVYGKRLGNNQPGDGYKYRGGGFIQTTGRANYAEAAELTGLPLLVQPDLLRQPGPGFRAAVAYWTAKRLNQVADFTDNVGSVRLGVNGGTNGLGEAKTYMVKARKIFPDDMLAAPEPAAPKPRPKPAPVAPEIERVDLRNVERQLLALYPDASITVDGVMDAETLKALLAFKVDWNTSHPMSPLVVDASVTPDVAQALLSTPLPIERIEASAKDIAPNSGIVRASGRGFKATVGALLATVSAGALDVLSGIFDSARRFWDSIKDVVVAVPEWAWWTIAVGVLIYAAIEFKLIERMRVKMHREAEVA